MPCRATWSENGDGSTGGAHAAVAGVGVVAYKVGWWTVSEEVDKVWVWVPSGVQGVLMEASEGCMMLELFLCGVGAVCCLLGRGVVVGCCCCWFGVGWVC